MIVPGRWMCLRILGVVLCALVLGSTMNPAAAASRTIAYQGFLTTPDGAPLNEDVTLVFRIYRDALGSERLWTETHADVPVRAGLFVVALGSSEPLDGVVGLFDVGRTYFVSIEVGTGTGELSPRLPLSAAPYALAATDVRDAVTEVDCERGETIADALRRAPLSGLHTIEITGTCVENVVIERSNTRIQGVGAARIVGVSPNPSEANAVVHIAGARLVGLQELVVQGAPGDTTRMRGILVDRGGAGIIRETARIEDVDGIGIHVRDGSTFDVRGEILRAGNTGVLIEGGSQSDIQDATIRDGGNIGVHLLSGSSGNLRRTTVAGNASCAILVDEASTMDIEDDNLIETDIDRDVCSAVAVYRGSAVRFTVAGTRVISNAEPPDRRRALDVEVRSSVRSLNHPLEIVGDVEVFNLSSLDLRGETSITGDVNVSGLNGYFRMRDQGGRPGRVSLTGNLYLRPGGLVGLSGGGQAPLIDGLVICEGQSGPSNAVFRDPDDGWVGCRNSPVELNATLTDSVDPTNILETFTYTATATNASFDPVSDALDAQVGVFFSGPVTVQTAVPTQGSCDIQGEQVTCEIGTLGAGASADVEITVQRTGAGTITGSLNVNTFNSNPELSFADNNVNEDNDSP